MSDAPTTALLAVNLGTPETPTAPAVRRYLAEFLGDPRVVSLPPLLWKPLLHGLILPLRSRRSAEKYAQVWLPEGSPLAVYTRRLAARMQQALPHWRVREAMRYGQPALLPALDALAAEGVSRIVVLPLYAAPLAGPQSAGEGAGHRQLRHRPGVGGGGRRFDPRTLAAARAR